MFAIKKCNKGTSFCYVSMITKIPNYFNIDMLNLAYKSPGLVQEFSQRTLTNLRYFGDINHKAYYFRASKNARKIYNFNDPVEFDDDAIEAHMDDEKPMGVPYDVLEGDAVMHNAPHGDDHGVGFSFGFADTSSIMIMLHNMQLRQDMRYVEDCQRIYAFEDTQMEQFCLMQEHMTTQDTNFEAFASFVIESLVSRSNDMNVNHIVTIDRIE